MRHSLSVALVLVLAATVAHATPDVGGSDAFEQLKMLAGSWSGSAEGDGEEAAAEAETAGVIVHDFKISAAGTVVMETMGPGSEHEMINMYHLDGEDLVLTHYCAGGNQPTMRLDRDASTTTELVFEFTGGTNLDPEVDHYIRDAKLTLVDGDKIISAWRSFGGGEQTGAMTFHLERDQE